MSKKSRYHEAMVEEVTGLDTVNNDNKMIKKYKFHG